MQYDWVMDVLMDLRSFAERNGFVALAAQLDQTTQVAAAELAQRRASDTEQGGDTPALYQG